MRRLIHIPIVHTEADLGSLRDAVREEVVRRGGPAAWERHQATLRLAWRTVRSAVDLLRLDPKTIRIYQDSLPVCGRESDIASEQEQAGSLNYQLIGELTRRGATLTGTESPELLLEQRDLALRLRPGEPPPADWQAAADDLLRRRDAFIGQRIGETLQDGETGLLFLGALHDVSGRLPPDMQFSRLGARPAAT